MVIHCDKSIRAHSPFPLKTSSSSFLRGPSFTRSTVRNPLYKHHFPYLHPTNHPQVDSTGGNVSLREEKLSRLQDRRNWDIIGLQGNTRLESSASLMSSREAASSTERQRHSSSGRRGNSSNLPSGHARQYNSNRRRRKHTDTASQGRERNEWKIGDQRSERTQSVRNNSFKQVGRSEEGKARLRRWRAKNMNQPFLALVDGSEEERCAAMRELRNGSIELSVSQFNDIVSLLSRQRKMREALSVMDLSERPPLSDAIVKSKSVKTYTIMIDVYGKGYQLSRAFSLFYSMSRNGVNPNVITYNAMIAACARNSEPELGYEVFEEMQASGLEPDKFTYGALIDSCAKCGKVDRAFEISKMMDENGVEKDPTIYSALMDACGRSEQLERALQVFEEMKRNAVWPNLVTFSVLIDTCANAREPERAFQLFSEVKHWGFPRANVVVYTALIDACAKSGWPERAEGVMRSMIRNGVYPNEITFGALMEGWARGGQLDRAFEVLRSMTSKHNVNPNAVLIGGLIDACRKVQECWRIQEIWDVVQQFNIRPSRSYYPGLITMATMDNNLRLATAILMHAYARGFLRRVALNSEDEALHAIACAIVYLSHTMRTEMKRIDKRDMLDVDEGRNKSEEGTDGELEGEVKVLRTVLKSISMSERDMKDMSGTQARDFCMSWGDEQPRDVLQTLRMRGGSRKDKRGVYLKDSAYSAAARRAKDKASALNKKG